MNRNQTGDLRLSSDQNGMVAIVVTSVLMVVISLIVIGFSQVTRREQRNALDHQLSTQAFYAAESGANLAKKVVQTSLAAGSQPPEKPDCPEDANYSGYSLSSAPSPEVKITCLLVTSHLQYQKFDNVSMNNPVVSRIQADTGSIGEIGVSWESAAGSALTGCSGQLSLPTSTNRGGCTQPLLRVDIVKLFGGTGLSQASLQSSQYTVFLSPNNSGATNTPVAYSGGGVGNVQSVGCVPIPATDRFKCTSLINGLGGAAGNSFGVRVMSIYGNSNVVLFANDVAHGSLTLTNGQVLIDSTAKAIDTLRRIQVRYMPKSVTNAPDFALVGTNGVCKRFTIKASGPVSDALCPIP